VAVIAIGGVDCRGSADAVELATTTARTSNHRLMTSPIL
jgi:hypothetical protein